MIAAWIARALFTPPLTWRERRAMRKCMRNAKRALAVELHETPVVLAPPELTRRQKRLLRRLIRAGQR